MIGDGKYGKECEVVKEITSATMCALIVINGNKGSGISMVTENLSLMKELPKALIALSKEIKKEIEKDIKEAKNEGKVP